MELRKSNKIDYIKIPHHCSKSSSEILKLIKNTPGVTCTTVFVANNLPNKELLKKYTKKVRKVYCTNNLEEEDHITDYGTILTRFNIVNTEDINTEVGGNAKEYFYIIRIELG